MRRARLSDEERLKFLEHLDKIKTDENRKNNLYNRIYRKSFIYIGSWVVRIIYFLLFIIVVIFNDTSKGFRDEILTFKNTESHTTTSRSGSRGKITTLYLETNFDSYTSNLGDTRLPELKINDTIQVERNIFGKPIYFTKLNWRLKYGIALNFSVYYIILFLTFVTFFFNDGSDPFTSKILWIAYAADIIAISAYFCT